MIKRNDLILVGILLLLCLGVYGFFQLNKEEGGQVVVKVDGVITDTYDLSQDGEYTIKGANGQINTFRIKDEQVDMIDASCPDKLCVNQHDIHYNHETIVCLPNLVVLEVISEEENDIDVIAN